MINTNTIKRDVIFAETGNELLSEIISENDLIFGTIEVDLDRRIAFFTAIPPCPQFTGFSVEDIDSVELESDDSVVLNNPEGRWVFDTASGFETLTTE